MRPGRSAILHGIGTDVGDAVVLRRQPDFRGCPGARILHSPPVSVLRPAGRLSFSATAHSVTGPFPILALLDLTPSRTCCGREAVGLLPMRRG